MRVIYRTCVLGGVSAGILVATFFATAAGLTPLLWLAVASFAVAIALFLAAMTKVVFGGESFSFLHYQLAALASTGALLAAMQAPVLPALDLLALTLAVAQGIGRLGCAHAGCCHGRPFRIGIRYDRTRVAEHWAGARLLPVQWLESAALLLLGVAVAFTIGRAHGTAFVLYATSYATVRFALELLRGDARRHFAGLSEAQWICLATAVGIALWQRGATMIVAALLLAAAAVLIRAPRTDFDRLARAMFAARATNAVQTAADLHISHGRTASAEHYTVSASHAFTRRDARSLAAVLRDVVHPDGRVQLVARDARLIHVIVEGGAP